MEKPYKDIDEIVDELQAVVEAFIDDKKGCLLEEEKVPAKAALKQFTDGLHLMAEGLRTMNPIIKKAMAESMLNMLSNILLEHSKDLAVKDYLDKLAESVADTFDPPLDEQTNERQY
jgi:hypothetical protein